MRYWLDTEFIENGHGPIHLLSLGVVAEDGREFYGVNAECPLEEANEWVRTNVLPHIDTTIAKPRARLRHDVIAFVNAGGGAPEFWGYYADYDWVLVCQLIGRMMDLPLHWPRYCLDVKQLAYHLGNPKLPERPKDAHHALADARWIRGAWQFLMEHAAEATKRAAAS